MGYAVEIKEREAVLVVSTRLRVALSEMGEVLSRTFGEIYAHLAANGVEPAGPPFAIYAGEPAPGEPWDVEICAPISRPVEAPPGYRTQTIPGGPVARVVHRGPYEMIGPAYDALSEWVGQHGRTFTGPPREIYMSEPDTPPERIETIVEWPVSEAPVPTGSGAKR